MTVDVHCRDCGEEVLGAVNRCWKCGRDFDAAQTTQPQVRRAPIAAAYLHVQSENDLPSATEMLRSTPEYQALVDRGEDFKIGSPFALVASAAESTPLPGTVQFDDPRTRDPIQRQTAFGAAVAAICLGLMALGTAFLTEYLAIPAVIGVAGLGLGVWGLSSKKPIVAVIGILICCIALSVAGFSLATIIFDKMKTTPNNTIQPVGAADWDVGSWLLAISCEAFIRVLFRAALICVPSSSSAFSYFKQISQNHAEKHAESLLD